MCDSVRGGFITEREHSPGKRRGNKICGYLYIHVKKEKENKNIDVGYVARMRLHEFGVHRTMACVSSVSVPQRM
jgi:hypothetical protein